MLPGRNGAVHLFRAFGINVYLHWTWFIAAAVLVQWRPSGMSAAAELVDLMAIFGIVLAHEFGHALACRSVGGVANQIVLWPLGGVAYVRPPLRPGAALWSIVAGPLVNVALVGVLTGLYYLVERGFHDPVTPAGRLLEFLWAANLGLLIFNMLPIYPLDGGQTLQAILWFFLGLPRSLRAVATIGMIAGTLGAAALVVWTLRSPSQEGVPIMLWLVAGFVVLRSWEGYKTARLLAAAEAAGLRIEG